MIQDTKYWNTRPSADSHRDWKYEKSDWIDDYWESRKHPHRKKIIKELKKLPAFTSLAEIGCNCGPNLANIAQEFPNIKLKGLDINAESVDRGQWLVPRAHIVLGNFLALPWEDKSIDVVLIDAVLMYTDTYEIFVALEEIKRITKKAVIIVDRFSKKEENNGYVWSRNYPKLLKHFGFKIIKKIKITSKIWPHSKSWQKQGYIYVSVLQ